MDIICSICVKAMTRLLAVLPLFRGLRCYALVYAASIFEIFTKKMQNSTEKYVKTTWIGE